MIFWLLRMVALVILSYPSSAAASAWRRKAGGILAAAVSLAHYALSTVSQLH